MKKYPAIIGLLLTVTLCAPGLAVAGTAYTTAVGAPPDPRTYAFYDWVDRLVSFRLAEAPIARTTTLHFSQAGNDTTGDGSLATPWKTMAKAQSYHDTTGVSDYALLFKAGEVWAESTGMDITDADVTVSSYGVGVRPLLHCFTNTIASGGAAWTAATGDRYTIATTQVGWIRDQARRLEPYAALASTGAVESNPRSWYWDGVTLHLNAGTGVDPNTIDYEWMGDVADDGINASGDGVRIHGLRVDGFGCAKGTGHQFYGIKASPTGTGAVVVSDTENYYSGLHATSQYTTASAGGITTFIHCTGGYVNRTFSAANIFNGYSASGGHEYVNVGGTARFGYLPDTTLPSGGADLTTGIDVAGGDTSSGLANLVVIGELTTTAETALANATWCDGRVLFNPVKLPVATAITDARCFIYGVTSTHRQPSAGHLQVPENAVVLDSTYDLVLGGTAEVLTPGSDRKISGWAYNTVWKLKDTITDKRRDFGPSVSGQVGQVVNCLIQVDGPGTLAGTKWQFTNTAGGANGVSLTNTMLVNLGARPFEPGVSNLASTLKHLATYKVLQAGSAGVDQSSNQVILDNPPPLGQVMDDSPLYRTGLPGLAVRVERDLLARPRDPVAPSIGPWEHAYASREAAVTVARIDSVLAGGVNVTQISGDAAVADDIKAMLDGTGGVDLDLQSVTVLAGVVINNPLNGEAALSINGSGQGGFGVIVAANDALGTAVRLQGGLTDLQGDVDVNSISGDTFAADNLEAMLDGTGGVTLTAKQIVLNNPDAAATALSITANGAGSTAAIFTATDAAGTAIATNSGGQDFDGKIQLIDADGVTDLKLREMLIASLAGLTTLTDNGNGTKTLRFFKQNGTTPLIDVTYNTNGEWTATAIDPAP